jgi:hypothetical protein
MPAQFLVALFLILPVASAVISGALRLGDNFNMSWTLSPKSSPGNFTGTIQITLEWTGSDWAAVGLHPKPGNDAGMANAEIFMCTSAGVQVRNSVAGYVTPTLDPVQYLKLISASKASGVSTVTFERTVAAVVGSPLSFPIANTTMGLIFARGAWQGGPFPAGDPLKHEGTEGKSQVDFWHQVAPSPAPPTPKPSKTAGVWPDRFDANMTIAPSQPGGVQLRTGLHARLRYSFPSRQQLWQYFDASGSYIGGELWVKTFVYQISPTGKCSHTDMGFDIIRPDWLQGTHYISTHYLLRPPVHNQGFVNYTKADLFQIPNTLGMTNSWVVEDSPIAEPIRLEGPDDFSQPSYVSILEFADFQPVEADFPAAVFDVDTYCNHSQPLSRDEKLAFKSPSMVLASLQFR